MAARLRLKRKALSSDAIPVAMKTARRCVKRVHPDRERQFAMLWQQFAPSGTSLPVTQFVFHPTRKWRFDFAWPVERVAVEIDGGVFQKRATGHRSIGGVVANMEKLNAAVAHGWRVLRFHARDLEQRPAQMIQQVADELLKNQDGGLQ